MPPAAYGFTWKKLMGYPAPATLIPALFAQGENAALPTMSQNHCGVVASALANDPACPFCKLVINPPFVNWLVSAEKAESIIGRGMVPATPPLALSAKLVPPFSARFACAFLNSLRNPFSKIFTSFGLMLIHCRRLRLPIYRISSAWLGPICR